jgi:hypothetical protein
VGRLHRPPTVTKGPVVCSAAEHLTACPAGTRCAYASVLAHTASLDRKWCTACATSGICQKRNLDAGGAPTSATDDQGVMIERHNPLIGDPLPPRVPNRPVLATPGRDSRHYVDVGLPGHTRRAPSTGRNRPYHRETGCPRTSAVAGTRQTARCFWVQRDFQSPRADWRAAWFSGPLALRGRLDEMKSLQAAQSPPANPGDGRCHH